MVKNTTTTTKNRPEKTITIVMSERRPVIIGVDDWPIIAEEHKVFTTDEYHMFVYLNKHDGRCIVRATRYFINREGKGGKDAEKINAGFLINGSGNKDEFGYFMPIYHDVIRSIRRASGIIENLPIADDVIAQLPGEYI